ncbi:DEAD/DEAH box helicase [Nocardia cyriacigeorgica]|uniref:DEAD/DEAH box helicase n=1 Tax=Nocardia cyriacigeorgica TaxID=135487 RepID=A0A6P1D0U0_9NOCA|nr:DEAD/DEAH box helicase [Nocardia cyriacigeorgica]NEW38002.1 DEAD/DEAH box helicase [Nocardia cyriacigeorgica]NEW42910.1 DEAD/DEAH box helicase [Nocardia cyriacigeorgica]NEW48615.1 DEAD/DEAH box helicase [Nocardia cyriacigeorgica]NEW56245.1 DEAD/DEAH box helicase [Nocardia cyriacigeorgica]
MPEPATAPATFAALGLPVVLVHALGREGIDTPFPIQAATIPDVLDGRDVLGRAPTGSGKTLAFGLPMLVRLAGAPSAPRRPRGLVLAPTRELAAQIESALDPAALALGLRLGTAVGGLPIKRQAERLGRGVDLLIGTPGRLADLVAQQSLSLDAVRVCAIDEADHLAELGFLPQVRELVDRVPDDAQHLLFSATLDDAVDEVVRRYLREPVAHSADPAPEIDTVAPAAAHHLLFLRKADKREVIAEIAARDGRTLLFVRTQYGADKLTGRLREAGIVAQALHGGKTQNNRNRVLAAFADGSVPVLVATDVAARGIHVDAISLVVHVDPPAEAKDYVHRAGRTARAGATGTVVTLVTEDQRAEVTALTRRAGIDAAEVTVAPGDRLLRRLTGARTPPGVPIPAPAPTTAASAASAKPRRQGRPRDTPGKSRRHTGDSTRSGARRNRRAN